MATTKVATLFTIINFVKNVAYKLGPTMHSATKNAQAFKTKFAPVAEQKFNILGYEIQLPINQFLIRLPVANSLLLH